MFKFVFVRFNVWKVLVVIVDKWFGLSLLDIGKVVEFLDEEGIKVVLVVVGREVDLFELEVINLERFVIMVLRIEEFKILGK